MTELEKAREHFNTWWIKGNPNADSSKYAAVLLAEIDRMGVAVSASPQPRCPKCGGVNLTLGTQPESGFIYIQCNDCPPKGERKHPERFYAEHFKPHDFAQFFATAPAQEPPKFPCPRCPRTDLHEHYDESEETCVTSASESLTSQTTGKSTVNASAQSVASINTKVTATTQESTSDPSAQPVENSDKSVCFKCRQVIFLRDGKWFHSKTGHNHEAESISGGASTGEQSPRYECAYCDATEMLTVIGPKQYACPKHLFKGVSRPSGPSAPKVEPQFTCENCVSPEVCSERMYCDKAGRSLPERPTQATETASAPKCTCNPKPFGGVHWSDCPAAPSVAGTQPTPALKVTQQEIHELRTNDQPRDLDWDKVHALLEPWQEVWKGDKIKFAAKYPEWMVNAAAEIFAHDICDAWSWNDYVAAATVIMSRHSGAARGTPQVEAGIQRIIQKCEQYWNESGIGDAEVHAALEYISREAHELRSHLPCAPTQPGPEEKINE